AKIPPGAGKGALRVLALNPQDCQAVRLQLDLSAQNRIIEPEAGIDRRQRERNRFLNVIAALALKCPARDRNIAVERNPLGIDEVAEEVVASDVIAARDRLVGRSPK